MKVLDYSINSEKNGGKVTAFTYTHSLKELCGTWSASVVGGNFTAGNSITFNNVMTNGIISRAHKDSSGLWRIEGYDAGVRLMCSTPDIGGLPAGKAQVVIRSLASRCGISLDMEAEGLKDCDVRPFISGSTCAEAILELAMFSGLIAFIGNDGVLHVQAPANTNTPRFENVIDDSGSDFDLEGYANHVTVILRKSSINNKEETHPISYTGTTPSTSPISKTYSGSFSNGSYSMTMLEPFDVLEKEDTTITQDNITIHTVQNHSYDYRHKIIWRGNQEYVLFAFIETGYTLTKTVTGSYITENSGILDFTETTTEIMTRTLSPFDAVGVPYDWKGQLDMVNSETITRSTVRTGGKTPTDDMPAYSPPFDVQITRDYSRELRGKGLTCQETEKRYEARQVGSISPVKVDGEPVPHFLLGSNLAIQTHSTPQWVEVDTYRTYYEKYDNDGNCIVSTRSEYCDNGSKWLSEHALSDTGDNDLNEYQKAYAQFSQDSQGLEVSLGSSVITSAWQFLELSGRIRNDKGDDEDEIVLSNVEDWYSNGEYLPAEVCPHYDIFTGDCNMSTLAETDKGNDCFRQKGKFSWKSCPRAIQALTIARKQETSQLDTPIIGSASRGSSIGYKREFYLEKIDGKFDENEPQEIADTIAANILNIKCGKGLRKTVTIPYAPTLSLDGVIVEISHDWENLTSQVTYRTGGNIPDFLVAQSVSSIAAFVSARDTAKLNSPKYGVISDVDKKIITVKIGNDKVQCTSKLTSLGEGDTVLVSFPGGNKLRGQVIARL